MLGNESGWPSSSRVMTHEMQQLLGARISTRFKIEGFLSIDRLNRSIKAAIAHSSTTWPADHIHAYSILECVGASIWDAGCYIISDPVSRFTIANLHSYSRSGIGGYFGYSYIWPRLPSKVVPLFDIGSVFGLEQMRQSKYQEPYIYSLSTIPLRPKLKLFLRLKTAFKVLASIRLKHVIYNTFKKMIMNNE